MFNALVTSLSERPVAVRLRWLLLVLILLGQGWLGTASASEILLRYATADAGALSPPTYSANHRYVEVSAAVLAGAGEGDSIAIQVSETDFATLAVTEAGSYLNGDLALQAQGWHGPSFYSLAVTAGQSSLFGHLSTTTGNYQLYTIGASDIFTGWLYQPTALNGGSDAAQNDYVIPDPDSSGAIEKLEPTIVSTLAFKNDPAYGSGSSDSQAASNEQIGADNFRMSQRFSRNPIIAGSSVEAQVVFENISQEWHYGLYVEFYFLLENSSLLVAPSACREQMSLSLQRVLYCDLGDFAPGESKSFIYVIETSEESKPHVISTPVIGGLRLDTFLNVVDDVRVDSDGDGISDFNERLADTDPADPESVDLGNSIIDVMALYSSGAAALYPDAVETRINQLVNVANQIYSDSGVGITLRPVYMGEVAYGDTDDMDTALNHLIGKSDPAFADVDSLRAQYGADLVMLFRPLEVDAARCGLATVGGFKTDGDFSAASEKEFAYSILGIDCPVDSVVAHELGHNMGLTHSHLEDGSGGTFNFSTGYGVDSQFVTVMAFPAAFNTETRIARFSDPLADCLGFNCGVDADDEFAADAVQSLNLVRHQIANFYPATVPDLPATAVGTLDGGATDAVIAAAVSADNGLTFTKSVNPLAQVDLLADIQVDTRHAGVEGSVHVLIGLGDSGFYQVDGDGNIVAWDGTIEGFVALDGVGPLAPLQRFRVLDNYSFGEELLGQQVTIYIAYRAGAEIVYTVEPLTLDVVSGTGVGNDTEIEGH